MALPSRFEPHASVRLLWPLLRACAAAQLDARSVLATAGIDCRALRCADMTLPWARCVAAFDQAALLARDPGFGLRVGACARESDLGLLHYLVTTAPTLRDAIAQGARHLALLSDGVTLALNEDSEHARLTLRAVDASPVVVDAWLALLLGPLGARLTLDRAPEQAGGSTRGAPFDDGALVLPVAVELAHPATPQAARYRQLWGIPVRFDAQAHALVLPRSLLDAPLARADAELHALLEERAQQALVRSHRAGFCARVSHELRAQLDGSRADSAAVARTLGVSRATLVRRLHEEGSSFRALVDAVRADRARRELAHSKLAIGEIAYALGFANTATFHRAFKRWTQLSPGEYRRVHGR